MFLVTLNIVVYKASSFFSPCVLEVRTWRSHYFVYVFYQFDDLQYHLLFLHGLSTKFPFVNVRHPLLILACPILLGSVLHLSLVIAWCAAMALYSTVIA